MKKFCLTLAAYLGATITFLNAQGLYFTKSGEISFFSSAPIEDIEARNSKVTSVIDVGTGNIEFSVLIMAFEFKKALMQEHFNESYMESTKFPKATFKGKITDISQIDFSSDGSYPATVSGQMTIHGVTKAIESAGKFVVKDGKISLEADFTLIPADYNIKIPHLVKDNIAEKIKVRVKNSYEPFKKS